MTAGGRSTDAEAPGLLGLVVLLHPLEPRPSGRLVHGHALGIIAIRFSRSGR